MIAAILLIGLLAVAAAYAHLLGRIAKLERRIEGGPRWQAAQAAEGTLPTATVGVRQAAPEAKTEPEAFAGPAIALEESVESRASEAVGAPPTTPPRESLASAFERLVGGRLLIWVGGIALGLAGLFLVRFAVEIGLIGPRVRMIVAAVFGILLLGAGEAARRRMPDDPRIGQALVGAGVLVLYAAAYGSHILYGLIGLGTAFAAMALVAGVALALSLRHGAPAAALGLVGGLLTPLLVGFSGASALPLLIYLALLNAAVFVVARRTARPWLAAAAKLGTLLWTGSLIAADDHALSAGLFVLVYAAVSSLAADEVNEPYPTFAPTFALLQLALLVAVADFHYRGWMMFGGLAGAGFILAGRRRAMAVIPPRAMPAALALILSHSLYSQSLPTPEPRAVLSAAAFVTLLFAGASWPRRGDGAAQQRWAWIFCAAVAGPALVLRLTDPGLFGTGQWGAIFALLALAPAALAWRLRGKALHQSSLALAGATATLLAGAAAFDLAPPLWLPLALLAISLGVLGAARRLGDDGLARVSIVAAGCGAIAAIVRTPRLWDALVGSLGGTPALVAGLIAPGEAMLLFAGPALLLFVLWRAMPLSEAKLARLAGSAAAAFGSVAAYLLFKQIFALGSEGDFIARGFAERTLLTQGLFFAGWLLLKRPRLKWLAGISVALTAIAAARFAWFDLLILNPAARAQNVGALPIFNLLAPAYLGSAFWLFEARRRAKPGSAESIFLGLFLAALIVGTGLLVRQLFHGAILTGAGMPRAEFYGYSLAGLLLSVGLLLFGWKRSDTPLRVAGLALLTATMVKVFLIDTSELEGVLRILSFLGLGIALIGMGKLYGTVLGRGASGRPIDGLPANQPRENHPPDGFHSGG